MSIGQITLVLTGARAGRTCELMKYRFIRGRLVLSGDMAALAGVVKYLGRTFKAFPENSAELAYYQALDREAQDGQRNVSQAAEPRHSATVSAPVQSAGSGAPAVSTAGGSGSAGPEAGSAGIRADGSGQTTGIAEALAQLDPENDEHWTDGGQPRVDVVSQLTGRTVKRNDILAVAPSFVRP